MRGFRNIWQDQRGNAAIIFGLAVIPLLALGGGAVDLAYRGKVRGEIQAAADTAAIAAARAVQQGRLKRDAEWDALKAEAEGTADQLLDTAFAHLTSSAPEADIDVTEEFIRISVLSNVKTSFLGFIGINSLRAGGLAEVNLPDPDPRRDRSGARLFGIHARQQQIRPHD